MRIAQGETEPSTMTGIASSTRTPASEPAKVPIEIESKASTEAPRKGRARNGMTAIRTEPSNTTWQSRESLGSLSASRPPSQYPTESATRTIAIVLAQTIVESPKYGASRRAPAISVPIVQAPTTNTSR